MTSMGKSGSRGVSIRFPRSQGSGQTSCLRPKRRTAFTIRAGPSGSVMHHQVNVAHVRVPFRRISAVRGDARRIAVLFYHKMNKHTTYSIQCPCASATTRKRPRRSFRGGLPPAQLRQTRCSPPPLDGRIAKPRQAVAKEGAKSRTPRTDRPCHRGVAHDPYLHVLPSGLELRLIKMQKSPRFASAPRARADHRTEMTDTPSLHLGTARRGFGLRYRLGALQRSRAGRCAASSPAGVPTSTRTQLAPRAAARP